MPLCFPPTIIKGKGGKNLKKFKNVPSLIDKNILRNMQIIKYQSGTHRSQLTFNGYLTSTYLYFSEYNHLWEYYKRLIDLVQTKYVHIFIYISFKIINNWFNCKLISAVF